MSTDTNMTSSSKSHHHVTRRSRSRSPTQKKYEYKEGFKSKVIQSVSDICKRDAVIVSHPRKQDKCDIKRYGPVLPPHLSSQAKKKPQGDIHGLVLSPSYAKSTQADYAAVCGPQLPVRSGGKSDLMLQAGSQIYGPVLPGASTMNTNMKHDLQTNVIHNDENQLRIIPEFQSNNTIYRDLSENVSSTALLDDECYGPLPPDSAFQSKAHIALEERALQIKLDSLQKDKDDHVAREEWMTELPEVYTKNWGLGPRQFRANPGPDFSDRSSWTDTPQQKNNKKDFVPSERVDLKDETKMKVQQKYDQEQEKIINQHKMNKRENSLMEIHQQKMKKQKTEEGTTRRPFNREIDLKINYFDESRKRSILKKAQLLDDRFSKGQSKFL